MIYLSPSSLQAWYEDECPARWKFDREWEPKQKNVMAEQGTLVHALMDGSVKRETVDNRMALSMYDRLLEAVKGLELTTIANEFWQKFEILPGVLWTRRIDRLALLPDGTKVIVDFKTTGGSWRSLEGKQGTVTPQAKGSQSFGYLIPHPEPAFGITAEDWPKSILYIVAGTRGPATVFRYDWDDVDWQHFFSELVLARDAIQNADAEGMQDFPKVYGKHCLGNSTMYPCPFAALCFESPGWKTMYTKRKHSSEKAKKAKKAKKGTADEAASHPQRKSTRRN